MKIAIIRLSALGDIIQSAIVLQFIKKFRPSVEIHWFVDAKFEGILSSHPLIDRLYALPLKEKKIFRVLKILNEARGRYDLVVDLQGLIKSALIARFLGVDDFGFDKYSLKESLAANFYNQKFYCNYNENVYIRYLGLICYVFNESFEKEDILLKQSVFEADNNLVQSLEKRLNLQDKRLILIHPNASVANKIYPKERLAILIKLLSTRYRDAKIMLSWGNSKEKAFVDEVLSLASVENATSLPKLSLKECIALTKLSSLIIGNDSGLTHLGFAMNKPSITIFGATPSARNAYETPINRVIDAGKKILDAKHLDKSDFCIQNVDEDEIFSLAEGLLGS